MKQELSYELERQARRIQQIIAQPELDTTLILNCFTEFLYLSEVVPIVGDDIRCGDVPEALLQDEFAHWAFSVSLPLKLRTPVYAQWAMKVANSEETPLRL